MQIEVAINKTAKYAVSESGDSAEVVERPTGGLTALIADGQGSGRSAKIISNLVISKAAGLVADGTRDGAVARAAHDFLFALRDGKVSATLTMLSVDLLSRTVVISRNSHCPVLIRLRGQVQMLADSVNPIGYHHHMKPVIHEIPLEEDLLLVTFTDGILYAGRYFGQQLELADFREAMLQATASEPQLLADKLFTHALALDKARPADDMTLLVLGINGTEGDPVGRLRVTYPL
ncbi:MAG: serine/threonine-protein phosphatase [Firmicutes bacterium]|nr:serine/threonine-protein phosphatase [Bacillota bacterium]